MIFSKYLLTALLILSFKVTFGHQDFYSSKEYGNVKVRIQTGYKYEEINKVFIFAQLAEKLSIELDYSGQIFLEFTHDYTNRDLPGYFISYDKALKEYTYENGAREEHLKENTIVIRQINKNFNAITTLQLLEYGIKNRKRIKSTQQQIEYPSSQWKIYSADTTEINQHLRNESTDIVKKTLNNRIYRPEENFTSGTSYYWLNNNYYLFQREMNTADKDLLKVSNIFQFTKFNYSNSILFDTDSTFYYIDGYASKVSKKQMIGNINDHYKLFETYQIDSNKVTINFWDYTKQHGHKSRTLLYHIEKDYLTQDLDKLIADYINNN